MVIPIEGKSTAIVQGGLGYAAVASPALGSTEGGEGADGISTDLPGSAGLTLSDIDELNAAMSGDIAAVIDRASSGKGPSRPSTPGASPRVESAASALASYIVTSHSINRAVIMGPAGSRVVTHNKPIKLEGVS